VSRARVPANPEVSMSAGFGVRPTRGVAFPYGRPCRSEPIELRQRLLAWKEQLLPKHPMAEAVSYALSQWTELSVFCSDGAVPIDNNVSEREMKRVVFNRKNSLFVGNQRGGQTAAILASLTSTCRRHDIDPQLYITQLLMNLPQAKISDQPTWLPDQWKLRQIERRATVPSIDHVPLRKCWGTGWPDSG